MKEWMDEQELIDRQKQKEMNEKMKRIMMEHEQKELDHNMMELKKAYAEVDKQDMSTVSTDETRQTKVIPLKTKEQLETEQTERMALEWVNENMARDNHTIIDPLLKKFKDTVWNQQNKVLKAGKYPHPIHKDNHTGLEWMDHQMSEFADALVYHECLKQTIQDVINDLHVIQDALSFDLTDREKGIAQIVDRALSRLERG